MRYSVFPLELARFITGQILCVDGYISATFGWHRIDPASDNWRAIPPKLRCWVRICCPGEWAR